jgi:hypothetical protein
MKIVTIRPPTCGAMIPTTWQTQPQIVSRKQLRRQAHSWHGALSLGTLFCCQSRAPKGAPCGPPGLTAQRGQARVFHAKNGRKRLADTQPNREQRVGKFTLDEESPIQGEEP